MRNERTLAEFQLDKQIKPQINAKKNETIRERTRKYKNLDSASRISTESRSNILILSGSQCRNVAGKLSNQLGDSFIVQSILKANVNDMILTDTALNNSSNVSNKDVVIIWPNRYEKTIIKDFWKNSSILNHSLSWKFIAMSIVTKIKAFIKETWIYFKTRSLGLNKCHMLEWNTIIDKIYHHEYWRIS